MQNRPNREGIWEWFEEDGTKRLVAVWNVEPDPSFPKYLRVSWWGGYYNVNDEHDSDAPEYDRFCKAEWPDRWGNYVGEWGEISTDLIYDMPTPEQMKKFQKNDN